MAKKAKNEKGPEEIPPELERYLALVKRIYLRMERENSWPWLAEDAANGESSNHTKG